MGGGLLITGANGMLGSELRSLAAPRREVICTDIAEMDVTDLAAVREVFAANRPSVVVHGGALTDVDGCETDPDRAFRVNALGTRNVALAAAEQGAPVLYVSTDYVFDGRATRPYVEFDPVGPRSVYGASKLAGERFVRELAAGRFWIVRTQWVYGFRGKNFVDTILAAARAGKPLRVVDDQIGCPTWARDLARGVLAIIDQDPGYGTYHCSSRGSCSWFAFAGEILRMAGVAPVSLEPMPSSELDRAAPRPAYSVLRNYMLEQTIGDLMPPWQEALAGYLAAGGDG
ncbi:MAG: dTDP-4-dehydrorhamnose reductase [Planctomycetes bacterium]|nr:dTDP-4-dehydrorhamnose reductase [Planctomycetota bacterium]